MKKVLLLFAAAVLFFSFTVNTTIVSAKKDAPANISEDSEIQWMSFEDAIKKTKKHPKKVFIDVYTHWCGWCKVMDKQTFTDPYIIAYMNANYYAVKFDAEQKDPITFKDKEYKFVLSNPAQNKGYHELAVYLLNGRLSYPTIVFMDEDMNVLTPVPGFRRPKELDMMLKFFGGDHYKNTKYEDFTKTYESPYPSE